jgi:hypothetical protein
MKKPVSTEKSAPMKPIVLTRYGETMTEPNCVMAGCHAKESDRIFVKSVVGVHKKCDSLLFLFPNSETHNVIFCQLCGLRIPLPIEVDTYGKLRQWCEKRLSRESEETQEEIQD